MSQYVHGQCTCTLNMYMYMCHYIYSRKGIRMCMCKHYNVRWTTSSVVACVHVHVHFLSPGSIMNTEIGTKCMLLCVQM